MAKVTKFFLDLSQNCQPICNILQINDLNPEYIYSLCLLLISLSSTMIHPLYSINISAICLRTLLLRRQKWLPILSVLRWPDRCHQTNHHHSSIITKNWYKDQKNLRLIWINIFLIYIQMSGMDPRTDWALGLVSDGSDPTSSPISEKMCSSSHQSYTRKIFEQEAYTQSSM